MACPTCDHTMHSLGSTKNNESIFWCPRCGTVKGRNYAGEDRIVPRLVKRAAKLCQTGSYCAEVLEVFKVKTTLSTLLQDLREVLESCTLPSKRKDEGCQKHESNSGHTGEG